MAEQEKRDKQIIVYMPGPDLYDRVRKGETVALVEENVAVGSARKNVHALKGKKIQPENSYLNHLTQPFRKATNRPTHIVSPWLRMAFVGIIVSRTKG